MRVKIRHIETLMELARQKSVQGTARALNVSQPAITKTMRELEAVLAVSLYERDGRGIKLTRYGEVFLRHAAASIAALRQGIDIIASRRSADLPPVRVGALPTVSSRIMPTAVSLFLEEQSGARLKLVTGENAVLLSQLRTGELDLVVGRLAAPDQMSGLSFEHLYSEEVVFVVRQGHPLLRAQGSIFPHLATHVILMPGAGSIIRPVVDRLLIANGVGDLPKQVETVSDSFGRSFLRKTDAVWIISVGVVANDLADGSLVRLAVDTSETKGQVGLTARADTGATLAMDLMSRAVREAAARLTQEEKL